MKIFLDSADLEEIKKYLPIIDGVTTNPTLIKRASTKINMKMENYIDAICAIVPEVSLEVVSTEPKEMIKQAKFLFKKFGNIAIKVPVNYIDVIRILSDEKIMVNATLAFSAEQAILAAKAGAKYTSIFIGRLADEKKDWLQVIKDSIHILKDTNTKLIVASIRNEDQFRLIALENPDVITVPPKILEGILNHYKTLEGIRRFSKDTTQKYEAIFK